MHRIKATGGIIALLTAFQGFLWGETTDAVRIAPFRGDHVAAVSYTFDDGLRDQFTIALPILDELRIPATFYIIPGAVADTKEAAEAKKPGAFGGVTWDELRAVSARGYEIGNHTWNHLNLTQLDAPHIEDEIDQADARIEKEIGIFPVSVAFPANASNPDIKAIALSHHSVIRDFQTGMGKKDVTVDRVNAWIDDLIKQKKWGVAMIHGIVQGFDPFDPAVLKAHLTYAKSKENDLWIDTFANVGRYVKERTVSTIQIVSQADKSVAFVLSRPPLTPNFIVPLTLIISAPGAISAEAHRNGVISSLPVKIVPDAVQIEATPGPEAIIVTWKNG